MRTRTGEPVEKVAPGSADRVISLGEGLAKIPERLLLAHARGEVIFLVGAGVSMASGLPSFRGLVTDVIGHFDSTIHHTITKSLTKKQLENELTSVKFIDKQRAEVQRFLRADYDVVLGMLERRFDGTPPSTGKVRSTIAQILRDKKAKPAPIHRSLIRLSNWGEATTVVTTNFEYLLENAAKSIGTKVKTYALGGIPRPGRRGDFSGVLHIHGVVDRDSGRSGDLVVTDHDFGEFYLRRRVVPDFIYDVARLFSIVLVGYSANDPPMRYLLNAVAADGSRFSDLKERFTFVGVDAPDPVLMEDWRGRGITPIEYNSAGAHHALAKTLETWAQLTPGKQYQRKIDAIVKNAVKKRRSLTDDPVRDLFDHVVRRGDSVERVRIAELASKAGAHPEWLDAILAISREPVGGSR